MHLNIISLLLLLINGGHSSRWRGLPLRTAMMRDVVNSRYLHTAAVSGSSSVGNSLSSAEGSSLPLSDDVSRGGYTKVAGKIKLPRAGSASPMDTEDVEDESIGKDNMKALKMDHVVKDQRSRKEISSSKKIAKKLKNRNHTNLRRKILHASFGLAFGTLNYFVPRKFFLSGMTVLSLGTLMMELLRYKKHFGWMNDVLHATLGSSLRKHEMEGKFTGSLYFFLGVTLTAAIYPRTCATLGIFQLALADPSASYFGRKTKHVYWSRIENGLGGFGRNKGILGFLGGAIFCFPFNYQLLKSAKFPAPPTTSSLLAASLALGLAGAFADLAVPTPALTLPKRILGRRVPPFHVDDNFVVPIFSGYAATKIFERLGWNANTIFLSRFLWL